VRAPSFEAALAVPRAQVLRSLAEIDALPDDVTHVDLRGLGDGAAVRLANHRQLRHVGIVRDDDQPFTKAGLLALARLPLLEELELNNLPNLEAEALTALREAKALRSLDIVGVRVDDTGLQVLPDLPGLTTLTLTGIKTFGDVGLQAIARCRGLQRLGLPNCGVLEAAALAHVGDLQQLVELDLRDNPGLLDRAVMSLQNCTSLRRLVLAGGQFSSMALQAVTGLRRLEALDLAGNDQLFTSALQLLPVGLRELGLANCQGLGADAATLLRDRFPGLRSLALTDNAWVTDAGLAAIVANPSLQQLQLNGCQQLTNASFATIRAARSLRSVHVVRTAVMSQEQERQLAAERPELQVVRQVW
jgi:Leucine-rich repeat (LRR) protein